MRSQRKALMAKKNKGEKTRETGENDRGKRRSTFSLSSSSLEKTHRSLIFFSLFLFFSSLFAANASQPARGKASPPNGASHGVAAAAETAEAGPVLPSSCFFFFVVVHRRRASSRRGARRPGPPLLLWRRVFR